MFLCSCMVTLVTERFCPYFCGMLTYHHHIKEWPATISQAKLNDIAAANGFRLGTIHFHLWSDEELRRINREHLNHDYYTDIITFPYGVGKRLQADIHISLDRVVENAEKQGVNVVAEMRRVIIHGILHLCGFDDKSSEEKEQMREQENIWLDKLFHLEQNK